MRTRIIILAILVALFHCNFTHSQDNLAYVGGIVLNEGSGEPVIGQFVQVEITSGGTLQEFGLFTNESGIFQKDSITVAGPGWVTANTVDCLGIPHMLEDSISSGNTSLWFEFSICSDSLESCDAFFNYELFSGPNLEVVFTNLSTGDYEALLWHFGDGNYSSEPNPLHPYEFPGIYQACLSIWNADSTCLDQYCQEVIVPGDSLDCWNFFSYETWNQEDFAFMGESYPDAADYYFWDFGDGTTGSGQTAFHTYSPITNTVTVVLTTLSYNPATGDTCTAVSSQSIMTGSGDCMANFTFEFDPVNSLSIAFSENSTSPVSEYLWDFGDGTTSAEMNPEHLFPGPGAYLVCLTIQTDSLGMSCSDTECKEIPVDFALTAGFTAVLDTLSGVSGTHYFHDTSLGNPDSWLWDFGDGQQTSGQNPVHQYEESGTYEVCLVVERTFPGGDYFQDQYCQTLVSPHYFDLGGQVYLDNIPMNNFNGDTTSVDMGIAYLYRKYENTLIPADTQYFSTFGYYWFPEVMAGNYLVRVKLTGDSENYDEFLPGYRLQAQSWQEAATITLTDEDLYYEEVRLAPKQLAEAGDGSISGYAVYSGGSNPLVSTMEDIDVFLLDQEMTPLDFTVTASAGEFSFEGIPPGIYALYSEVPGMFTIPMIVEVSDEEGNVTGVALNIFEQSLGISTQSYEALMAGQVYPNPVKEKLSIDLSASGGNKVVITVFSITGQVILEESCILIGTEGSLTLDVNEIPSGVYLLTVSMPAINARLVRKFVK